MRIKATEIKIGTMEDFNSEVLKAMKKEKGSSKNTVFVPSASVLSKILSPKRIELLKAIKHNPGAGVSELAGILKRRQEAISRDVAFLRAYRIIETEYENRKVVATTVPKKVVIEI